MVRVYVSSTYTDMMLEKNVLVTEVYPRLKELCRERYGLEFQVSYSSLRLRMTPSGIGKNVVKTDCHSNHISELSTITDLVD